MTWPKVMVTGHRPQHLNSMQRNFAQTECRRLPLKLRDQEGMEVGISGLALGVDTWWAWGVIAAMVDLWSFVPFPEQADRWRLPQQAEWEKLVAASARVWEGKPGYSAAKLHARNDRMLEEADAVVAVWDPRKLTGGTASAVRKAEDLGKPIIHVDLQRFVTVVRR